MPRHPLLPLLRIGAVLAIGIIFFWPGRTTRRGAAPEINWATDTAEWGPGSARIGEKALGPLPGQKRPPCAPRAERELAGACWEPHLERPPCPPTYYEGDGMCLKPVAAMKRPATSIGR